MLQHIYTGLWVEQTTDRKWDRKLARLGHSRKSRTERKNWSDLQSHFRHFRGSIFSNALERMDQSPPCGFQMSHGSARCRGSSITPCSHQYNPPKNSLFDYRFQKCKCWLQMFLFLSEGISGSEERLLATQQLFSNEGEVMAVGHPRMLMPNVHLGCYSGLLLSEGLVVLAPQNKRRDEPHKNLTAFPCEYRSCFRPDFCCHLCGGNREWLMAHNTCKYEASWAGRTARDASDLNSKEGSLQPKYLQY